MALAPLSPLPPRARLLRTALAWVLLVAASPGLATADGSAVLCVLGLGLWGATAVLPGTPRRVRGLLAELLPNALGGGALMAWVWYVYPGANVYVSLGFGLWWTGAAVLVRRLARRLPAGVAIALGVLGAEGLRAAIPTPFGLGWLQLGHHLASHLWVAGSARVWGLEGLSLVVAGLGGLVAVLLLRRRPRPAELAVGLGPLALAVVLSLAVAPPVTEEGPLVLCVQPGFSQERKQFDDATKNFTEEVAQTARALGDLHARGEEPDLVAWAESMLYVMLFDPRTRDALAEGDTVAPWMKALTADDLDELQHWETEWVRRTLFGEGVTHAGTGVLPPGTSFLAGSEEFAPVAFDDHLVVRRRVAVALYDRGQAGEPASRSVALKRHLVPGAETMLGLERLSPVRAAIQAIAAYVPDFVAGTGSSVLTFHDRVGRPWSVSTAVCFDNAFLGAFAGAFTGGPVDFHLVASNEAWYRGSFELDQMVAFSRVAALATGRSVLRATNSGITVCIGPDGRELGRARKDGRDRSVAATLSLHVPVPRRGDAARPTPYVRTRLLWVAAGIAAPLLGLLVALLASRRRAAERPAGPASPDVDPPR